MKNDVVNVGNEKKGNKFMDKFFFGYLSLKWRRLVRTIFIVNACIWVLFFCIDQDPDTIPVLPLSIALPILISYLVEPFVRKQH